ncbi:MAG: hydroxymethylpyrimidine/phosphomethylpyrimidine kinase [Archaeoglobus sp.]|nr:hydroxymethylpyrimidine/phosphomethylpyrimidine kinase [Archaeoglobus sp.]
MESKNVSKKEYRKPSVVSIAGLDPSGCAGLLLDVRVIGSLGFHPCGVVSAITFQNTCKGYGYEKVSPETVEEQLKSILEDKLIAGVKIGLLNSTEVAEVIVELLEEYGMDKKVILWDPVYASTTNLKFQETAEFAEIAEIMSAIVSFLTPNAEEAELLSGVEVNDLKSAEKAAKKISQKLECAVVITGGKLRGIDVVYDGKAFAIQAEYSPVEIRGTGCVYSSALTCYLAKGESLEDAARHSRLYLLESVKRAKLTGKCLPCSEVAKL